MTEIVGEDWGRIVSRIDDARKESGGQFRANLVVQIATLRLLIDKGAISVDEAVQQIEETQRACPEIFDREDVTLGVTWATHLLRGEVPLHGSIVEQQMQKREREARSRPRSVAPGALGQSQVYEQPRKR